MEINFEVNINEICRNKKIHKKWSNAKIAELSGIPVPTVNSFFGPNAKSPSFETTWKICRVLGVSIDNACGIKQTELPAEISQMIEDLKGQISEKDSMIEFGKAQEIYLETRLSETVKEVSRKDEHIQMLESIVQSSYKQSEMMRSSFDIAESHANSLQGNLDRQKSYIKKLEEYNSLQLYVIIALSAITFLAVVCSGWFLQLWEIAKNFI